jgi:hypothetical protein
MDALKPFPPDAHPGARKDDLPPARRVRSWRAIAQEVAYEPDPAKLTKLVAELNQALDEQGIGTLPAKVNGQDKVKGTGSHPAGE